MAENFCEGPFATPNRYSKLKKRLNLFNSNNKSLEIKLSKKSKLISLLYKYFQKRISFI